MKSRPDKKNVHTDKWHLGHMYEVHHSVQQRYDIDNNGLIGLQ